MSARGVNKVIIVGNLGRDPEVKYMSNGNAVTKLAVATSEVWKDKTSGEQQEKTEWHPIIAFGKLAEIMGQYLKKGSKVYVEGKLQTRMWEKEGQKHYTTEIIASEFQMLDGKGERSEPQQTSMRTPVTDQPSSDGIDPEEDIPF